MSKDNVKMSTEENLLSVALSKLSQKCIVGNNFTLIGGYNCCCDTFLEL